MSPWDIWGISFLCLSAFLISSQDLHEVLSLVSPWDTEVSRSLLLSFFGSGAFGVWSSGVNGVLLLGLLFGSAWVWRSEYFDFSSPSSLWVFSEVLMCLEYLCLQWRLSVFGSSMKIFRLFSFLGFSFGFSFFGGVFGFLFGILHQQFLWTITRDLHYRSLLPCDMRLTLPLIVAFWVGTLSFWE